MNSITWPRLSNRNESELDYDRLADETGLKPRASSSRYKGYLVTFNLPVFDRVRLVSHDGAILDDLREWISLRGG